MIHTRPMPVLALLLASACTSDPGVTVHNADPRAEITSHADGDSPDAGLRGFTGTVEDPDHDAEELTLSWLVDGAEACPPVSPDASGNTSCEIFLESGERTVSLQVEDPLGGLASDKVTLDVQPYGDPWAEITEPLAGGIYYSDQLVELAGVVGDDADVPGDLEAWWESSIDADLEVHLEPDSSGNVVGSEYLSEGEHQLLLKVRNSGGNEAYDSVTVTVGGSNSAPSCEILSPESGAEAELAEPVLFTAMVDDPDIPEDWLGVRWSSDEDGELGESSPSSSGEVLASFDDLSVGVHVITMTVSDEVGATCADHVSLNIQDCPELWYRDADGDGYGDPSLSTTGCEVPSGYVAVTGTDSTDCDDGDAAVNPGASEVCDSQDNDCDGDIDDADSSLDLGTASTWHADVDADGYGDATSSTTACAQPSGTVADSSDCDDGDAAINPGATEVCNGSDDDCDGDVDDADASLDSSSAGTWYADADGDGYGDALAGAQACTQPTGTVADSSDCDDSSAGTFPGADEHCDGVDTDCDGTLDEDDALDASGWYADLDGDGYGDPLVTQHACTAPSGYIADDTDCDDSSASIHPGADEYCDGVDTDCDGMLDDDDALDVATWYLDGDGDGYGDSGSSMIACSQPSGYVAGSGDCDDNDAGVWPGASEAVADGVDQDCDGGELCYQDGDGDGYGSSSVVTSVDLDCLDVGEATSSFDCDDGDSAFHPGATEYCDTIDHDCDGEVVDDESVDAIDWYLDADGDGYGNEDDVIGACEQPSGYVDNTLDADDEDPSEPNPWSHDIALLPGDGYFDCAMGTPMPTSTVISQNKHVAAWVRLDAGDGGGTLLDVDSGDDGRSVQAGYAAALTPTQVTWQASTSIIGTFPSSSYLSDDGQWHLVEFYCAFNSPVELWIDGVSLGTSSSGGCHGNNPAIGALIGTSLTSSGYGDIFAGYIGEMTVAFATVVNDPTPGVGLTTTVNTIAHWVPTDDGQLIDETGNGNDCVWVD